MARRRVPRAMRRHLEEKEGDLRQAPDKQKKVSESERSLGQLPPSVSDDGGYGKPLDDSSESESFDGADYPPWTEEDVIDLLRAMADFARHNEMDPITNIKEFMRFKRMWMSFPVRKPQLLAKILALRLEYYINLAKDNKLSLTPFEAQVFRFSRIVWGEVEVEEGAGALASKNVPDQNEPMRESPYCPVLLNELINITKEALLGSGFGERYLRAMIAKTEETKVNALEERWKEQNVQELSIRARQVALVYNTLKALP